MRWPSTHCREASQPGKYTRESCTSVAFRSSETLLGGQEERLPRARRIGPAAATWAKLQPRLLVSHLEPCSLCCPSFPSSPLPHGRGDGSGRDTHRIPVRTGRGYLLRACWGRVGPHHLELPDSRQAGPWESFLVKKEGSSCAVRGC